MTPNMSRSISRLASKEKCRRSAHSERKYSGEILEKVFKTEVVGRRRKARYINEYILGMVPGFQSCVHQHDGSDAYKRPRSGPGPRKL